MAGQRAKSKHLLFLAFLFICISFPSVLARPGGPGKRQMLQGLDDGNNDTPETAAAPQDNRRYALAGGIIRTENGISLSTGPVVVYLDGQTGISNTSSGKEEVHGVGGNVTQGARDAANDTVGNGGGQGSNDGKAGQPRGAGVAGKFLRAHNEAREKVGMPPLKWDRELSRYARRYAMQRKADCEMIHSTGGQYGENIFWGYSSGWKPSTVVELWVEEQKDYDPDSNSCKAGMTCGHYTQVVWKTSQRLGCAKVVCDSGDVFVSCNYDPPGNYQGISPFVGVVV